MKSVNIHNRKDNIKKHNHKEKTSGKYLGDFVYGAIDGIVTTFAVVSGVTGAALSSNIILILGFANLIADGMSMATGNFLSIRSDREYYDREKKREEWEIENQPEEEKADIKKIYANKGFSGKDLDNIVNVITSNKEVWVDTMMKEELDLSSDHKSPWRGALTTYAAFVALGLIPLLAYVLSYFVEFFNDNTFTIAIIATSATLFLVGVLKTYITKLGWLRSGLETMFVGGLAAGVSYLIGYLISLIV